MGPSEPLGLLPKLLPTTCHCPSPGSLQEGERGEQGARVGEIVQNYGQHLGALELVFLDRMVGQQAASAEKNLVPRAFQCGS